MNEASLLAELEEKNEWDRENILEWMDKFAERGYLEWKVVPTGLYLRQQLRRRELKQQRESTNKNGGNREARTSGSE